jgi:hypothetical protein
MYIQDKILNTDVAHETSSSYDDNAASICGWIISNTIISISLKVEEGVSGLPPVAMECAYIKINN